MGSPAVLTIDDLSGGRNGYDTPSAIPNDQTFEALNVEYFDGGLGRKRNGATAIGMTSSPFTGVVSSLLRYVPAFNEADAEFWGCDSDFKVGRLAAGTAWATPTLTDTPTSSVGWNGIGLGGFFHLAFDTNQNRLHLWDASLAKVRRSGLATPGAAPTGADDGAGGLSLTRSYRVRFVDVSGSDTRRMSEASATLTRTIAAKAGSTITRPTAASEDETHWDLEAADTTAGPWYRIARTAIATTTFDDTSSTISTTNPSPSDGINFPPPSAKFLAKYGPRLILAGNYETSGGYVTPKNTRVWWTPVIGDTDIGDLERIPTGFYRDVGDAVTGLGGPIQGAVIVFTYRGLAKLQPTGLSRENAFEIIDISHSIGCIHERTIQMGEDENGDPALYFLSHRGPYRYGVNGLQYLGTDVEDVWETVNLDAATIVGHTLLHPDKHQWWVWVSTGSNDDPQGTKLMFDTRLGVPVKDDAVRKGWVKHTGSSSNCRCACLFSSSIGASMGRRLLPHIGQRNSVNTIWKCDNPSATDDASNTFQAYVETKDYLLGGLEKNVGIAQRYLLARVSAGVTITCTVIRQSDTTTTGYSTTSTVSLTASGAEAVCRRKFESGELSGGEFFRFRIGDSAAVANGWTLDALTAVYAVQEPA